MSFFGKERHSIRFQLLGSFLLLTVVLSVAVGVASWLISEKMVKSRIQESFSLALDYVCAGVRSDLDVVYGLSDYIFTNAAIKSALEYSGGDPTAAADLKKQAYDELAKFTLSESCENVNRITITGNSGMYLRSILNYADYTEDGLTGYYPEWTAAALAAKGAPLWSGLITRKLNPYIASSINIQETVLYRSVKNKKYTSEIGMQYISVNNRLFLSQIQDYYSNYPDYQSCSIFILDKDGAAIGKEDCPLSEEQIRALRDSDPEAASAGVSLAGLHSTVYLKQIRDGWSLVGIIPQSMYVSGNQYLMNMTLIIFPVCIIACCLIWLVISSGIFRPLHRISETMRRIAGGESALRIESIPDNEVGQLGKNLNHMLDQIDTLNRENSEKQIRMLEAQYRARQAQINPHFIYNTLNSIRWMAVIANADNIKNAIDAFWIIEKYHTNGENQAYSTIAEEVYIVKQYIYLQKLSYGNRFDVDWDIQNGTGDCECIRFFLQPLVENSIKHGVIPKDTPCVIGISVYQEEDRLVFNIYDDGAGMDEATLSRLREGAGDPDRLKGHVGLLNILERLKYAYGDAVGIDISSKAGLYTNIMIRTPLKHIAAGSADKGETKT